ncbi:MAG: ubiquitin-like domain-containing protein [Candidatus Helarchaeota archaeon]
MIIRIVSAIGGDVMEIQVPPNTRIVDLKREISQRKRIPTSIFVLAFRGTEIRNENQSLADVGINDYDKLYLIARTEGGSPKN